MSDPARAARAAYEIRAPRGAHSQVMAQQTRFTRVYRMELTLSGFSGNRHPLSGYDCLGMSYLLRLALIAIFCGLLLSAGIKADCADDEARAPKPVSQVLPDYPSQALQQKITGDVTLGLWVNVEGKIVDVHEVLGDKPILNDAALASARKWSYSAAQGFEPDHYFSKWISMTFTIKNGRGVVATKESNIAPIYDDSRVPPILIHHVDPVIPSDMKAFTPGRVIAELELDSSGQVVYVCIFRSDSVWMNEPALAAARKWKYKMPDECHKTHCHVFKIVTVRIDVH
jgi:TonB family protein